ncbi:MAG TPA: MFS transporter, partial [Caulobacteraceae bacterium]|nr:MFS transporter [Caulobacteraceae bacterium]
MALRDMPDEELKDASGFNNLMRNLGGAVGIAAVNTWLIEFSRLHAERLVASIGKSSDTALSVLTGLVGRFGENGIDPSQGRSLAAATMLQGVRTQALALAFDDVFRISAWIFAACLLLVPFCKGGPMSERVRGHHH